MNLLEVFSTYDPITLSELDSVALMDRKESKFIIPDYWCEGISETLKIDFRILDINGNKCFRYKNLYFDTKNNITLEDHIRGRNNRFKIRIRNYVDSELTFLEVKRRNVYGRSTKYRITRKGEQWDCPLTEEEKDFLKEHVPFADKLRPILYSSYSRYTLASLERNERITFDTELTFNTMDDGEYSPLPGLSLVELKQNDTDRRSPLHLAFRSRKDRIAPLGRSLSVSKYTIGRLKTDKNLFTRAYVSNIKKLKRAKIAAQKNAKDGN